MADVICYDCDGVMISNFMYNHKVTRMKKEVEEQMKRMETRVEQLPALIEELCATKIETDREEWYKKLENIHRLFYEGSRIADAIFVMSEGGGGPTCWPPGSGDC